MTSHTTPIAASASLVATGSTGRWSASLEKSLRAAATNAARGMTTYDRPRPRSRDGYDRPSSRDGRRPRDDDYDRPRSRDGYDRERPRSRDDRYYERDDYDRAAGTRRAEGTTTRDATATSEQKGLRPRRRPVLRPPAAGRRPLL